MEYELNRLVELLDQINPDSAIWIRQVIDLLAANNDHAYKLLNSKEMWGGAGSIANDALADNPGLDDWQWEFITQEFYRLMIDIATELKTQPQHYPDIDFWLSSFTAWSND